MHSPASLVSLRGGNVANFSIAAHIDQVRSEDGHRHIIAVLLFLVVPADCLDGFLVDLLLQFDHACDQSLRGGRAAGDVHINGQKFINARDHVITFLERSAARSAGAHRHNIFWLRHLVVQANDGLEAFSW